MWCCCVFWCIFRSLQGNRLSGQIPSVIGLMQALTVLWVFFLFQLHWLYFISWSCSMIFMPKKIIYIYICIGIDTFFSQRFKLQHVEWNYSSNSWKFDLQWENVSILFLFRFCYSITCIINSQLQFEKFEVFITALPLIAQTMSRHFVRYLALYYIFVETGHLPWRYLHGNRLTGSIPAELGNMSKLHYL